MKQCFGSYFQLSTIVLEKYGLKHRSIEIVAAGYAHLAASLVAFVRICCGS